MVRHLLEHLVNYFRDRLLWAREGRRCVLRDRTFRVGGRTYRYFLHPYNHTWKNERAVEIPLVYDHVSRTRPERTLELGNVLSHYFPVGHTVVDKYERSFRRRVLNDDIVSFNPARTFDLIVSISTVEHIGWDEAPRNPEKVLEAFSNVRRLLSTDGRAVIVFPAGYNDFLDQSVRDGRLIASEVSCLKRMSSDNDWEEVDVGTALACSYGEPFEKANAVVLLVMRKADQDGATTADPR